MADIQLQQQDPVLGPAPVAWPAKPSNMKERSLVQQYPLGFLKNGILHHGQADQCRGTLEHLVLPSSLWPDVPKDYIRDYISSCKRCTLVPCFRKKEGDMMLDMVVR